MIDKDNHKPCPHCLADWQKMRELLRRLEGKVYLHAHAQYGWMIEIIDRNIEGKAYEPTNRAT